MMWKIGCTNNWRTIPIFYMLWSTPMVMGTYSGSMEERVVQGTYLDAISWIFGTDFVKCLESGKASFQ